ncbi:MAG: hypothetical protein LBM77_13465, partial [Spirochaetaceae bacterium]|nr:hypothetical protein [Spirochaetaceae bacterium]
MYTAILHIRVLIALLKAYKIRHVVISAGTQNASFAYSIEEDDFFNCYSVVDERSAAFFAMGLSQELNEPVAICCTSSTATCNYLPALTEAFYQGIPLVVLTFDRHPYLLNQMENQMIDQHGMFKKVCKKYVQISKIENDDDYWYCERLINEALLEVNHGRQGPVHINIPTYLMSMKEKTNELPIVHRITRYYTEKMEAWNDKKNDLVKSQRIMILAGQNANPTAD